MEKVKLIEICTPKQWKTLATSELKDNGKYLVYGANGVIGYYDDYNHEKETVLITCRGATCGNVHISKEKSYINGNAMALDNLNEKVCLKEYLYYFLKQYDMKKVISGSAQPQITIQSLKKIEVKITDKDTQIKIVKKLNKIQQIIDVRKKQIGELDELIKSQFVEIFGNPITNDKGYPLVDFINIVKLQRGYDLPNQERDNTGNISVYGANGILDKHIISKCSKGIITGRSGTIGKVYYSFDEFWPLNTTLFSIETYGNNIIYLKYLLDMFELKRFVDATGVPTLNRNIVHKQKIIKVPIELQNKFAEFVKQINKQKIEIQKSLEKIQKLQESLMDKCFQ